MPNFDFDVVFLSYKERNANDNYDLLRSLIPYAIRLHGIQGLCNALKMTADIARTDWYFLVDGDSQVNLSLKEKVNGLDLTLLDKHVYVWQTKNAVNDLVYGFGGVKLVHRDAFNYLDPDAIDPLSGCGECVIFLEEVLSVTAFNSSPFDAWKAGFRECCSLIHSSWFRLDEAAIQEKINIWMTKGEERPFGIWAILGAKDGVDFAFQYFGDLEKLRNINDFSWLWDIFISKHSALLSRGSNKRG